MLKSRLIYLGIILVSFVFSQALYEPVSFMTFVIVLVLPIISILIAIAVYPLLSVKIVTNNLTVNRLDDSIIRIIIKGICPFISPSVKITGYVPDENGLDIQKTIFAVSPAFSFKSYFDYSFRLINRGNYSIKITSVEYYDFLKLVRIKKRFKNQTSINVVPRKIKVDIPVSAQQFNQENTYVIGENTNANVGEMVGVRDYVMGDNLKNVHWKLSSKSEDLVTKTYAEDICDKAYIIVDMSAYYEDLYINKSITDCVVEVSLCAIEEYAKTNVRFGVILSDGMSMSKRYSVANPSDKASASYAVTTAQMVANTDAIEMLGGIDFNLLSGSEVLFVTSFKAPETLKDVQKIFLDKKVKLKIVNILADELIDNPDVIIFTRDYLENHIKGIK